MIELINVTKYYPTDFGRHYVFRNVSLTLPLDKSVGVVGPNGAGKSTFLGLVAGADTPNEGRIVRSGRISPPMGLTPGLLATLTGSENTRFACRIHGMTRSEMDETVESVRKLADIGKYFDMPVATYSSGMRQRVGFAISMSLKYDYYLFDEIGAGGDRKFREVSQRMVQERLQNSKFIITSHRLDELINLCQAGIVIMNGELRYFDDIKDAMEYYGETAGLDVKTGQHKKVAKPKPAGTIAAGLSLKPAKRRGAAPMGLPITRRAATSGNSRNNERQAQIDGWSSDNAPAGPPGAESGAKNPPTISPRKLELARKAQDLAAEKTSLAMRRLLRGLDMDTAAGHRRKRAHVLEVATNTQLQAANAASKARGLCPWIGEPQPEPVSGDEEANAAQPDADKPRAPVALKSVNGQGRRPDLQQN